MPNSNNQPPSSPIVSGPYGNSVLNAEHRARQAVRADIEVGYTAVQVLKLVSARSAAQTNKPEPLIFTPKEKKAHPKATQTLTELDQQLTRKIEEINSAIKRVEKGVVKATEDADAAKNTGNTTQNEANNQRSKQLNDALSKKEKDTILESLNAQLQQVKSTQTALRKPKEDTSSIAKTLVDAKSWAGKELPDTLGTNYFQALPEEIDLAALSEEVKADKDSDSKELTKFKNQMDKVNAALEKIKALEAKMVTPMLSSAYEADYSAAINKLRSETNNAAARAQNDNGKGKLGILANTSEKGRAMFMQLKQAYELAHSKKIKINNESILRGANPSSLATVPSALTNANGISGEIKRGSPAKFEVFGADHEGLPTDDLETTRTLNNLNATRQEIIDAANEAGLKITWNGNKFKIDCGGPGEKREFTQSLQKIVANRKDADNTKPVSLVEEATAPETSPAKANGRTSKDDGTRAEVTEEAEKGLTPGS